MTALEKLQTLYDSLPTIECKRKCGFGCCGPIVLTRMEARRLEEKRGYLHITSGLEISNRPYLPPPELIERTHVGLIPNLDLTCVFFEPKFGSCMAYKMRPLVCHLWGMVDNEFMRCPHGCMPSRWMNNEEVRQLHFQIIDIQKEWENENH